MQYIKVSRSEKFWKVVISRFLPAAIILSFACNLFLIKAPQHTQVKIACASLHTLPSSGLAHFQYPSIPVKANIAIESFFESDDDVQVGGLNYQLVDVIIVSHHLLLDQNLVALPTPFFQNQVTVPLFILYHSWKSFLYCL